jgi:hypothetical protein
VLEIGLGMHSQFYQIHEIEKAVTKVGFNTVEIKEEDSSIRLCFKKNN